MEAAIKLICLAIMLLSASLRDWVVPITAEHLQLFVEKRNDTSSTVHLYVKESHAGGRSDLFTIMDSEAKITLQREKVGECRLALDILLWYVVSETCTKKSSHFVH